MKNRLKELRKSLKLTQQEFGKNINLSGPNISNMEKGNVQLTPRNINEICSTYNVNKSWLENGEGEMFSDLTEDDEFNILIGRLLVDDDDSFKKKVIREMLKLDDEDWFFIEKFISKIKS